MLPLLRRRADALRRLCRPSLMLEGVLAAAVLAIGACSPLEDAPPSQAALTAPAPLRAVVIVPPPPPKPPVPAAAPTITTVSASTPRPTWSVVPMVSSEHDGTAPTLTVTQATASTAAAMAPQRTLRSLPSTTEPALPSVPSSLPTSPAEQAALLTRPPIAPPITPLDPPGDTNRSKDSARRCVEAVNAARSLVERPLDLPVEQLKNAGWKEEALRATELAQIACRGESGEQAAHYWRATAFVLHGQYARAAVNYRRVTEFPGAYANWGYVQGLASMLDSCARADRDALDAWTLGGLLEARGASSDARLLYSRSVEARCAPLRNWSKARMAIVDG